MLRPTTCSLSCCYFVPADAGVVPTVLTRRPRSRRRPRARRGWTVDHGRLAWPDPVVPAHAGVVLRGAQPEDRSTRRPRARGGGPSNGKYVGNWNPSSLPTRGWSVVEVGRPPLCMVFPVLAGGSSNVYTLDAASRRPRTRGGSPAEHATRKRARRSSPRTRGWSPERDHVVGLAVVVPAQAGVVQGPAW